MKRKAIVLLLAVLLLLIGVVAVGCNKDEQNFTVTLIDGDTTSSFSAAAGADIANKLELADTADEYFGGWYYDDEFTQAEDLDGKMPSKDVTLYAKRFVKYALEVYLQPTDRSTDRENYLLSDADSIFAEGKKGETVTFDIPQITGFYLVGGMAETTTLAAKDTVRKFYFNRESYTVAYNANLPEDAEVSGKLDNTNLVFGLNYSMPENPFDAKGYRFVGWSFSKDGEELILPGASFNAPKASVIYAIWSKGYVDRFDSDDEIYINGDEIFLQRDEFEFEGKLDPEDNTFSVTVGKSTIEGALFDDYTFAYKRGEMAGTYKYKDTYYQGGKIDDEKTLYLDGTANAIYKYPGGPENGVKGKYSYDATGEVYSFIASEGDNAGHGFYFTLSDDGAARTFAQMGAESGVYVQLISHDAAIKGYLGDYQILLDGFGGAVIAEIYHKDYYYGEYKVETFNFSGIEAYKVVVHAYDSDGWLFGKKDNSSSYIEYTLYCVPQSDISLFILEDKDILGTYTENSGGATLTLNDGLGIFGGDAQNSEGTYSATYVENDVTYNGTYYVTETEIFGKIIEFSSGQNHWRFDISDSGEKTFEDVSNFTERWLMIQDPERAIGHPLFTSPMLVLFDEAAGPDGSNGKRADVYLRQNIEKTEDYNTFKAASGYYTVQKMGEYDVYTFVRTSVTDAKYEQSVFTSAVFLVNEVFSENEVPMKCYYVYESNGKQYFEKFYEYDANNELVTTYYVPASPDGNGGVTYGFGAAYGALKVSVQGSKTNVTEGRFTVGHYLSEYREYFPLPIAIFNSGEGESTYYWITEVDKGDGQKEKRLTYTSALPQAYQEAGEDGDYPGDESLIICEDEGFYLIYDTTTSEHVFKGAVKGSVQETGTTAFGDVVYTYTPDSSQVTAELPAEKFDFVLEEDFKIAAGMTIPAYHRYYGDQPIQQRSMTFTSKIGTLTVDGYSYRASFRNVAGSTFSGHYY